MRVVLAVAAALMMTAVAEQDCPHGCDCRGAGDLRITCLLPSARFDIEATFNKVVNFECEEGGSLRCSELPRFALARNETLPNLGVVRCALPESLHCMLVAIGASDVKNLAFKGVTNNLLPEHVTGLDHLQKLMLFDADGQTSVPIGAINVLPSLRHFRLNGGGALQLQGDELRHSPPLEYLEISNRDLRDLPSDAFLGLSELKVLNLWGNKIENISVGAFKGLSSLRILSLNNNALTTLPTGVFAHTPQLRELTLSNNMLSDVSAGVLSGMPHLRLLIISSETTTAVTPQLKLGSEALTNLPELTDLQLDGCNISSLPTDLFVNTSSLVNITLSSNNLEYLPEELLRDQMSLEKLDLERNKLTKVTQKMFANLKALKEINLDRNFIEVLPDGLFSGLTNLTSVSINRNRLGVISDAAFRGATSLVELSLSMNLLSWSEEQVTPDLYFNLGAQSPFRELENLQRLDLSGNRISYIFSDWRYVLIQNLRYLDLSRNRFRIITQADVQFLNTEITVDLRYNDITTVVPDIDAYSSGADDETHTNKLIILLDDNPFTCDCYLYRFIKQLKTRSGKRFSVKNARCSTPLSLGNELITEVSPASLVCSTSTCPDECQCNFRPQTERIEFDCSSEFAKLPNSSSLEFGARTSSLRLRHVSTSTLFVDLPDHVRELNASGLGLRYITLAKESSVNNIDLSRNKLTRPPLDILASNVTLRLAENPFQCDCQNGDDVAALQRVFKLQRVAVSDNSSVTCAGGGRLDQVDAERLCLVWYAQTVGGTLVALSVMIAAIAILWYRYSLEIRVFVISRMPWLSPCFPAERFDSDKIYDAFISFAHRDEKIVVDHLIPKLEGEYGLKLCVHFRDWEIGELIPTQIIRSVEWSRRTVVVLSKSFLASVWAKLEFRAAHIQALQEGRTRVVVVLLEEVEGDERIDDELRAYLTTNTYIKWGDPWFWSRLRDALPRRDAARDLRKRAHTRAAVNKFARGGLDVVLTKEGKLTNAAFVNDSLAPARKNKCDIQM